MKFRKKPIIVEAEQYLGPKHVRPRGLCDCGLLLPGIPGGCQPHVHTIHDGGRIDIQVGDWIIPEPDGLHYYPVKDEIFRRTYEPIE